ncbi:MAG: transglutaminase family protein, partial [Solirubrobacteraceae bacterium]
MHTTKRPEARPGAQYTNAAESQRPGAKRLLPRDPTEQRPLELSLACGQVLGREHGFAGDRERYDHPDNSMLDIVLS